jgi:hypothetical protein
MSVQQASKHYQKGSASVASKATPIQPKVTPAPLIEPKPEEPLPTFATVREWLKGKEVTISAPNEHAFTKLYCETKLPGDAGILSGVKILDIIGLFSIRFSWSLIRFGFHYFFSN